MHLYLDTSALLKKYFWESGSADIINLWKKADSLSTSSVAYAEALAACYRKNRENPIQINVFTSILDAFQQDWQSFICVEVNDTLHQEIGRLIALYPLRGFDAIHLASALTLNNVLSAPFIFACFDKGLHKAARSEKIQTFPVTL